MTIFFYRDWPEIRNTPVLVYPNIWKLWHVRDTKFGTNVPNEMLMNAGKCHGYSFNLFWIVKGKPTRGVKITQLPPTQIRVKVTTNLICWITGIYSKMNLWPSLIVDGSGICCVADDCSHLYFRISLNSYIDENKDMCYRSSQLQLIVFISLLDVCFWRHQ